MCTDAHAHAFLLIHVEYPNPQISGSGLVMLVMFLVVCLWGFTDGLLPLSWAGVSVDPGICWSLGRLWSILSVCAPGCLVMVPVWWRYSAPVSLHPRVRLLKLSHCEFLSVTPHFLKNLYYYYYNNCIGDWVEGKRQHCEVGKFSFLPDCWHWFQTV